MNYLDCFRAIARRRTDQVVVTSAGNSSQAWWAVTRDSEASFYLDASMSLLELGLDSLLLTQGAQLLQRKFSVSITFRQLMEELGSLETIAEYLDATLPKEAFAEKTVAVPGVASALPPAGLLAPRCCSAWLSG